MEKADLLELNNFIPLTQPPHLDLLQKKKKKKENVKKKQISPFLTMFSFFIAHVFHFKYTINCCL